MHVGLHLEYLRKYDLLNLIPKDVCNINDIIKRFTL